MTSLWHESPLRVMGSGVLEARLQQALDHLPKLGVRVPPSGRHAEALKLLTHVNRLTSDLDPRDQELLLRLQYAHRDAYELFLIVYAASLRRHRADTPFTTQRLQAIMAGSATGDGTDPYPRNIQFELYIAAMLVLGSLDVSDGEPDLRLLYGRELVGVAVKRLQSLSPDQAERTFKKGIDQIERSGMRGLVAVNLDSRFTGTVLGLTTEQRIAHFEALFEAAAAIFDQPCKAHPRVLGYLAFAYISEWQVDPGNSNRLGLFTHTPFRWLVSPDTDADRDFALQFSDAWRERVESHLERVSGRDPL